TALQFIEQRADEHRAGRADRMAEGDRATVHVNPIVVELQVTHRLERDSSKCLVDLPKVDIGYLHSGLGQRPLRSGTGCGQHDERLRADGRGRADAATWGQPV